MQDYTSKLEDNILSCIETYDIPRHPNLVIFSTPATFCQDYAKHIQPVICLSREQKKRFGQDEHGICPVCHEVPETMDHVFQCQEKDALLLKQHLLEQFYEDLEKLGTPLAIRHGITAGLGWWLIHAQHEVCPKAPGFGSIARSAVWSTNAYAEQTGLGWGQLLRGRLSKLWGEAYVKELQSNKPKEAHAHWTKKVIGMLWTLAFALWDHRNGVLRAISFREISGEHATFKDLRSPGGRYTLSWKL